MLFQRRVCDMSWALQRQEPLVLNNRGPTLCVLLTTSRLQNIPHRLRVLPTTLHFYSEIDTDPPEFLERSPECLQV